MIDAWKHMPHDVLVARFLRPLRVIVASAITSAREANDRPLSAIPQDVMVCTQLLSIIYAANRSSATPLDKDVFCVPEINETNVDLGQVLPLHEQPLFSFIYFIAAGLVELDATSRPSRFSRQLVFLLHLPLLFDQRGQTLPLSMRGTN